MSPPTKEGTVAITGCSGLIGSWLVQALANRFRIAGLDLHQPELEVEGFNFIQCDLTKDDSVSRAIKKVSDQSDGKLASVVHLAAYYDFSGESSPLYNELTVEGTRRLLRALEPLKVQQFIFSSSLLVMKPVEQGKMLDEDSSVQAEWDYPKSKLAAEKVIREEHDRIPAVVLRLAGVYDENCHSLPISQQIRRIYEKQFESRFFPGNAEHGQSFLHLDDLVECVARTIDHRDRLDDYELFLIGEEDVLSYEELQDRIGEILHGEEWPTIRIPKAVAKAGAWVQEMMASSKDDEPFIKPWMVDLADQNYPVSIRRARQRLDWAPQHTLRNTLDAMLHRLKRDPRGWYEANDLPLPDDERLLSAEKT